MENTEKITESTSSAATAGKSANKKYINTIVGVGVLTAIVIVLQLLSTVIRFGPFSITLALTAIIVGGAVYGLWAGGWLGLVLGIVVLLQPDTAAFLTVNAPATILVVLVKSTAAGILAALVYKLIEKKNRYASVITASVVAPVVNTGIFIIGSLLFFTDLLAPVAASEDKSLIGYIFTGLVGLNFPVELIVNLALSTVTVTVIGFAKKNMANS